MTDNPLAWISADMSSAITARQLANIPELGGDPSELYPIPLYRKEAVMTDTAARPDMVRELEWSEDACGNWHGSHEFGGEFIQKWSNVAASIEAFEWEGTEYNTEDAAKAAAQADYASRIASALSPAFIERMAALEAALRAIGEKAALGVSNGLSADMVCEDIFELARTTLQEHAEDGERQGDEG